MSYLKKFICIFSLLFLPVYTYSMELPDRKNNSGILELAWQSAKEHPFVAGTALIGISAAGFYAYKMHQDRKTQSIEHLARLIRKNPSDLLDITIPISDKCNADLQTIETQPDKILFITKLLERYNKQCPLFLLGECSTRMCGLTRKYWPEYRAAYERKVVNACTEKLNATEEPVQYVSFGCGGLLQDVITLTKILEEKPDASLVIHLIDPKFRGFTQCADLNNGTRQVSPQGCLDLKILAPHILKIARVSDERAAAMPDQEILDFSYGHYLLVDSGLKQFCNILSHIAPNAKLTVLAHESTQGYLDYIQKNKLPHADIITSADIQDEMSSLQKASLHYCILCLKTLQQKPECVNIWLSHNACKEHSGELTTISLIKNEKNHEENLQEYGIDASIFLEDIKITGGAY